MLTIRRDSVAIEAKAAADLDAAKANASADLVAWVQGVLDQFTAGYPTQETLAWGAKMAAARHVLTGGHDTLIDLEAATLGIPSVDLAQRVVAKGAPYEQMIALASALRGATQAQIAACTKADDLAPLLDAAKARARAVITQTLTPPSKET